MQVQSSAMQLTTSSFHGTRLQCSQAVCRAPAITVLPIRAMKDVQGRVVSVGMQKTAVVQVDRYVPHRLYGKRVRRTKKFFAHDEDEVCNVGDFIEIVSCAPISKQKAFKVKRILRKSDL